MLPNYLKENENAQVEFNIFYKCNGSAKEIKNVIDSNEEMTHTLRTILFPLVVVTKYWD